MVDIAGRMAIGMKSQAITLVFKVEAIAGSHWLLLTGPSRLSRS